MSEHFECLIYYFFFKMKYMIHLYFYFYSFISLMRVQMFHHLHVVSCLYISHSNLHPSIFIVVIILMILHLATLILFPFYTSYYSHHCINHLFNLTFKFRIFILVKIAMFNFIQHHSIKNFHKFIYFLFLIYYL